MIPRVEARGRAFGIMPERVSLAEDALTGSQSFLPASDRLNVRRMFSGAGVFADGLMIALVVDGAGVDFKADERTICGLSSARAGPRFSYLAAGMAARTLRSYWRMPRTAL